LSERRVIVQAFKNLKKLMLDGAWHPHILVHYSLWQENGHLLLHSELCEKGDLGRLFDGKAQRGLLMESDIWEVVKQMLPTIHFMHSRGVLHMDLKPANIYVTSDDIMKLGDFATSVCREFWKEECDIHEGDAGYLAVEVLRDHYLSPAADIFSFGMTLHRLVTGYCVNTSSLNDKHSFLKNPRCRISDRLTQVILSCVHPNPELRARSEQLLSYLGLQATPSTSILSSESRPSSPFLSSVIPSSSSASSSSSSSSPPPSPTSISPVLTPLMEMQVSSPLELPSPSSSSSISSLSALHQQCSDHLMKLDDPTIIFSSSSSLTPTPPSCGRRIVLSPRTPTTTDKTTKRKRRLGPGRHRSLRDL
jgi:serine/threonine protein kinase